MPITVVQPVTLTAQLFLLLFLTVRIHLLFFSLTAYCAVCLRYVYLVALWLLTLPVLKTLRTWYHLRMLSSGCVAV